MEALVIYMPVNTFVFICWIVVLSNNSDNDSLSQHVSHGLPINPLDMESHSK